MTGETDGSDHGERPSLADRRDTSTVYGAAEDSHLLASVVNEAVDPGERALDVGTGTGYVGVALRDGGANVVGVDVNPHACTAARGVGIPVVRGDLLTPFRADSFDLIACNPPYLPTPTDDGWDDWMETALSGGADGRRVVEPLLSDVPRVLTPDGRCYLLVSSLTDVDAVLAHAADGGLDGTEVDAEKHAFERLVVLRFDPV